MHEEVHGVSMKWDGNVHPHFQVAGHWVRWMVVHPSGCSSGAEGQLKEVEVGQVHSAVLGPRPTTVVERRISHLQAR